MKTVFLSRFVLNRLLLNRPSLRNASSVVLDVDKFGTLDIKSSFDVDIDRIDCQKYPDQNLAFAHFVGEQGLIKWNQSSKILALDSTNSSSRIEIPVKFNILATIKDRNISIKNLQNESIKMAIDGGKCAISNILSNSMSISSKKGDIICDSFIQSNASFEVSESGDICIKTILGETLSIKAAIGNVDISALYAENSFIETGIGNINIANAHKTVKIKIFRKGNIKVGSLDGSLDIFVNEGNVEVFAYKHESMQIVINKGNVKLLLPENCKSSVNIESKEIDVSKEFNVVVKEGSIEDGKFKGSLTDDLMQDLPALNITCKEGKVQICKQNWLNAFLQTKN